MDEYVLPRVPASAGALLRDGDGRILILKPTYKSGWTVPGARSRRTGSRPGRGAGARWPRRPGSTVTSGRLACVDFLRPRAGPARAASGSCSTAASSTPTGRDRLVLQAEEISEARWVAPDEAVHLLSGPVGRRVARALAATGTVYLEDGRPVPGVGAW